LWFENIQYTTSTERHQMTDNTQPEAPAAPRPIKRFYRGTDCMAENQAGDWVRYEDHVTAAAELLRQRARIEELEAQLSSSGFAAADLATASAQGVK
jgi:hypothetical protein